MTREEAIKVIKSATVYTPKEIEALETLVPGFTQSEDDRILNALITHIRIYEGDFTTVGITRSEILDYLEKLKKQKPAEWSEEDEKMINMCCSAIKKTYEPTIVWQERLISWLKSLRPSWKPSEEQMEALKSAQFIYAHGLEHKDVSAALESLYNDLNKLM